MKFTDKPLPTHDSHSLTSPNEFKKSRSTWNSLKNVLLLNFILGQEIRLLQTWDKLSAEQIAEYTIGYGFNTICFDAIRAKNKP